MLRGLVLVLAACSGLLAPLVAGQQATPPAAAPQPLLERIEPNAYDVVADWALPYPKPGYAWGSLPGVFAESPDRIFVAMRGEIKLPEPLPAGFQGFYGSIARSAINAPGTEVRSNLIVLNRDGTIIERWSQWDALFAGTNGPHKVRISPYDPERRVWVVNETHSTIYVFSNDGKQLHMTLGEKGVAADDETHFGRPQDVAFLPDGSVVVADGLTNSRVVNLDRQGKFVKAWGRKGSADGEFNAVHGVEVDRNRRIYVADRANKRVQVFDENGTHLATWPNIRFPNHILVSDKTQDVWVGDNMTAEMVKYDTSGKRLYSWHASGKALGGFGELHEFSVDSEGTVYVADNVLGRLQKLRPKAGADPAHLLGPPVALMPKAKR